MLFFANINIKFTKKPMEVLCPLKTCPRKIRTKREGYQN